MSAYMEEYREHIDMKNAMTVAELIHELCKIPNQNLPVKVIIPDLEILAIKNVDATAIMEAVELE